MNRRKKIRHFLQIKICIYSYVCIYVQFLLFARSTAKSLEIPFLTRCELKIIQAVSFCINIFFYFLSLNESGFFFIVCKEILIEDK